VALIAAACFAGVAGLSGPTLGAVADPPSCPIQLVGYMSDTEYQRWDEAPMSDFNYRTLGMFLAERHARNARLEPIGEEIAYWAKKFHLTPLGINMADLHGATGQYLAMRATALAYARCLDEYFAILSLIQFADGRISWSYHLRDIGGQLIEANAWIWPNVTNELLAALNPEAEGRLWTCLRPRMQWERAVRNGERAEPIRVGGLSQIREMMPYQTKFINGDCPAGYYKFPAELLKPGDIVLGVGKQPLTDYDKSLADEWHIDCNLVRFAMPHSVGVVVRHGDKLNVAGVCGGGISWGPVGNFVLGGKEQTTIGVIVLRPTENIAQVQQQAERWLERTKVRPDWNWLDSPDAYATVDAASKVWKRDADGRQIKTRGTTDYSLRELWFYLDSERLGSFMASFGVERAARGVVSENVGAKK